LLFLSKALKKIFKKYRPDRLGVERLFFFKNNKTAFAVGESRGMILVTSAEANVPVFEITPLQVKNSLTGYGLADKKQIQTMVKLIFKLKEVPKPDDAADALAIAFTASSLQDFLKKHNQNNYSYD
jgi:crossover junction endodeoxyribonuclease RuvC